RRSTSYPAPVTEPSRFARLSTSLGSGSRQGKYRAARGVGSCTLRRFLAGPRAALFALVLVLARPANARNRQLFEPTDLEMEKEGLVELDVQMGAVRGEGPWRVVVPDVELDIGLTRNVELDVDGAYAIEGPDDGSFSLDHAAPDNVWIAAKLGLFDSRADKDETSVWAIGAQI